MKENNGFCFCLCLQAQCSNGKKCFALKSRLIVKMEMNKTITWKLCKKTICEVFAATLPVPCVIDIRWL